MPADATPEDVGGTWGFRAFLESLEDAAHPEHEEQAEWVGYAFDPEAFDLEAVNRALHLPRITRRDLLSG